MRERYAIRDGEVVRYIVPADLTPDTGAWLVPTPMAMSESAMSEPAHFFISGPGDSMEAICGAWKIPKGSNRRLLLAKTSPCRACVRHRATRGTPDVTPDFALELRRYEATLPPKKKTTVAKTRAVRPMARALAASVRESGDDIVYSVNHRRLGRVVAALVASAEERLDSPLMPPEQSKAFHEDMVEALAELLDEETDSTLLFRQGDEDEDEADAYEDYVPKRVAASGPLPQPAMTPGELVMTPERFLAPFTPATRPGTVICVSCGDHDHATDKISEYPTRYLPCQWTVDGTDQAVRCRTCSRPSDPSGRGRSYAFWLTNTVLLRSDGSFHSVPRTLPPNLHLQLLHRLTNVEAALVDVIEQGRKENVMMSEPKNESSPATTPTLKNKAVGQAKDLGGAVMGAGQMILVNQSGEILLRMARKVAAKGGPLGEWIAPLLEDEDGREFAKLIMALVLHSVGTYAPLPKGGDALRKIGHIQTQTSTFVLGNKYIGIIMAELGELMALGDQLSDAFDTGHAQLPRELSGATAKTVFENASAEIPESA